MIRLQIGLAEIMSELVISMVRENVRYNEIYNIIIRLVEKREKHDWKKNGSLQAHLIKVS